MKEQIKEPRRDCQMYRENRFDDKASDCRALNDLYCKYEECRFYKQRKSDNN